MNAENKQPNLQAPPLSDAARGSEMVRNQTIEEAARRLEIVAGEMFNNGAAFHQCAEIIRQLKTCEHCGQKMDRQWDGKNWTDHKCASSESICVDSKPRVMPVERKPQVQEFQQPQSTQLSPNAALCDPAHGDAGKPKTL